LRNHIWMSALIFGCFFQTSAQNNIRLIEPKSQKVISDAQVPFTWNEAPGATEYLIEFSASPNFSSIHSFQNTVNNSVSINAANFTMFTRYYWRVSSDN